MQSRFSYLKLSGFLAILIVLGGLSSCFKKNEAANNLTTNIFDREYSGERWYEIDSIYYFVNILGQSKARVEVVIPKENLPKLRPSNIQVSLAAEDMDSVIIDFPQVGNGNFERIIDLPYDGVGSYCISLGIFVPSDSTVINRFDNCGVIE